MGGQELFEESSVKPVRCIICNRIKQPPTAPISADLEGMRCDERCPGYTLDPRPRDGSITFLHRRAPSLFGTGDELTDVIGRALCEVHFGP